MSSRPSTSSSHLPIQTPSIPPALHSLANPIPCLIDSQLPNYLLPNLLNLLNESSKYVIKKKKIEENQLRLEGLIPKLEKGKGKQIINDQEEEEKEINKLINEEVNKKIERIGLMVGGYIAEKLTIARPPLANHLDIIKFICKDLFLYVYSKQIDNLRTNHRGIFVLQSHSFPPLIHLSSYKGSSNDIEIAKSHLLFPQALIQGALSRLGMQAIVTTETSGLPQCTFQIREIKLSTPNLSTPSTSGTPNLNFNSNSQNNNLSSNSNIISQNRGISNTINKNPSTGLGINQTGI
ncbi:uncharacterized protein I206_105553 [Kwoniella pini CBS 10737]|uniref:Transporter particle component n=1 Tax=Kwoniella pini CBS 10737 TaxID=1296096 RepID=A0A1B9I3X8_9TREE|nr:uncharacterized protein I206_03544 [Kwoniella pini CBS 10737]OCF50225.1 hypothetical protein I206_03544 [Kwoniella pini CBS 10737]